MSNPAFALQEAMRGTLLAHAPLVSLLQGHYVYDEVPRGANIPMVVFGDIETRDWSTAGKLAHEHFVTLEVKTNRRDRSLAQAIVSEVETALDGAALNLAGHALVNLRLVFWSVARLKGQEQFGATVRYRAATEPL